MYVSMCVCLISDIIWLYIYIYINYSRGIRGLTKPRSKQSIRPQFISLRTQLPTKFNPNIFLRTHLPNTCSSHPPTLNLPQKTTPKKNQQSAYSRNPFLQRPLLTSWKPNLKNIPSTNIFLRTQLPKDQQSIHSANTVLRSQPLTTWTTPTNFLKTPTSK